MLFLDEIQSAPEVFARLRYFFEDTPEVAVIAAGSLLESALTDSAFSVPVGRVKYLYLSPMIFEEFLMAFREEALLQFIKRWDPHSPDSQIPEVFHQKLGIYVRDFSFVGGMPEAMNSFVSNRDFLKVSEIQQSLLETYKNDFSKYRKRIPIERLDRVFNTIPAQIGKKWVHARVNQHEKAGAIDQALELLCLAKVAHRVFHSSGNGVPLAAEQKDNLFKVLFLDVGLAGALLGVRITELLDWETVARINEGAIAEQWIGQHLLHLREFSQSPELYYWVREKAGSMAEVDYLISHGSKVIPIEVKSGTSGRAKSLQVFLNEKRKSPLGVIFSPSRPRWAAQTRFLELPFYMVSELPRLLNESSLF
jgi:predicted AAA+ superfamily ATPase